MSIRYELKPTRGFLKDFDKLEAVTQRKTLETLEALKQNPYSGRNIKKLSSINIGVWRIRIGDYRVRYDIDEDNRSIILYMVKHRKDIYKS